MPDEGRRRSMREYQKRRAGSRRETGLVSRTTWICDTDADEFAEAVRPFAQHARLMEGVNGTVRVPPIEMAAIIREHALPYDPEEMVFLSRVSEHLALHPEKRDRIVSAAMAIMDKHPERNFHGVLSRLGETDPGDLEPEREQEGSPEP